MREQVTNTNKLGRVYNMVQHPTIGPPFLDETTVIDANGRKGLISYRPLPNPEEPAVYWPQALKDGQPVNIRYLVNDHDPNVAAYTIDDEYGWVVACNASKGLLIGYLWKAREYPWLIDWRHVEKGKPFAEVGVRYHQPASSRFGADCERPCIWKAHHRAPRRRSNGNKIVRSLPVQDSERLPRRGRAGL